jgi:hypothetical protein
LDGVEIKLLFSDKLLERQIKADRALVDDVLLRRCAEQLLQAGLKCGDFFRGDRLGDANEFRSIARVDIDAKHTHPLRWIGDTAGLAHASATEGADRGHVQNALQVSGAGVAGDFEDGLRVISLAVDELVRRADFEEAAMHHQTADRPPALGTRVRPQEHGFAAGCEVADGRDQMRRPDPGSREEHDHVDLIVGLHLFHRAPGFLFRGDHDVMLRDLQTSLGEGLFRLFD